MQVLVEGGNLSIQDLPASWDPGRLYYWYYAGLFSDESPGLSSCEIFTVGDINIIVIPRYDGSANTLLMAHKGIPPLYDH